MKNHPDRQLGNTVRERTSPFPSDQPGTSKAAPEDLVQPPRGSQAHRRQKKYLPGTEIMATQSGSNKPCTIHRKEEEGVKSTPRNILERVFVIIPLCAEHQCWWQWSHRRDGALGTNPVVGLDTSVLGGLCSGNRQETLCTGGHCPRQREQMGSTDTQRASGDVHQGDHLRPAIPKHSAEPFRTALGYGEGHGLKGERDTRHEGPRKTPA